MGYGMKAGPSEQTCSGLYLNMRQIGVFLPQEISPRVPEMLLESLVLTAPWGGTEDPVCTPTVFCGDFTMRQQKQKNLWVKLQYQKVPTW